MSAHRDTPRILYVSEVWPSKAAFGGELRCLNVLQALQQIGDVEVVILDDGSRNASKMEDPRGSFNPAYALEVKQRPNNRLIEKIRWTLDPRADYPNGCGVGREAMRRVLSTREEFDLIWFFQLRSSDAFPNEAWPNSVVDIDNVPSTNEQAVMKTASGPGEYLAALRRRFTWQRRERLLGERFTVLTVCSEEDKDYLNRIGTQAIVHVVPNGFDRPLVEPVRSPATPPRIGFIGLFDYLPNREGIHWFVNKCWGRIKREIPDARLRLVGSGSDGPFKPAGPDVDGLGWLENPSDEINTWSGMIVPLHAGAGTRIKIAQAFSQKCPIISTTFGAYGYGALNGREMYLADSAEEFSRRCISVIREPEIAAQMAERAWGQFVQRWTWDAIRPRVWAAAEDCLRRTEILAV